MRDLRVFVDMGRPMSDGSSALLKTRQHMRRKKADSTWKDLAREGWQRVPGVRRPEAEP